MLTEPENPLFVAVSTSHAKHVHARQDTKFKERKSPGASMPLTSIKFAADTPLRL
jgi:hypothetical protein